MKTSKSITFFHIPKTGGVYTDDRLKSLFELVNLSRIGKKYTGAPYNYGSVGHKHASLSIKKNNPDDSESIWKGNQFITFGNREVSISDHVKDSEIVFSAVRNPFDLLVSYFCHNAGIIYDINTLLDISQDSNVEDGWRVPHAGRGLLTESNLRNLRFYPNGKYLAASESTYQEIQQHVVSRENFGTQRSINDYYEFLGVLERFDRFFAVGDIRYGLTFPTGWRYLNFDLDVECFREFIEKFCDDDQPFPFPAFKKFMFYNTFLDSGKSLSTHTIRYEKIDDCLVKLFSEFGEKYTPENRKNASLFRCDNQEKIIPYQDFYNDKLISLVRKKCERELDAFNYDFDFSDSEPFVDMSKIRYSPKTDEFKIT